MLHRFKDFLTINESKQFVLPKNIILLSTVDNNNITFLLYDTKTKEPIGYIGFGHHEKLDLYTVGGAFLDLNYIRRGYGKFLYESAMTYVYPKGLSLSRDGATSADALNVWTRFDNREDIKKERIHSDEITQKHETLPEIYGDKPERLDYIYNLVDTKFFYNYGKSKLDKLMTEGKKYQLMNNISDEDIEYMTWDLE